VTLFFLIGNNINKENLKKYLNNFQIREEMKS